MNLIQIPIRNLLLTLITLIFLLTLFTISSNSQSCDEPMPVQSCTTLQIENECSGCSLMNNYCCPATGGCGTSFNSICNGSNCSNINICEIPDECTGTNIPHCSGPDLTDCSACSDNDFCCPSSTGGTAACNTTFDGLCNGNTCTDQNICKYVPLPPVHERDFTFVNNCSETVWVGAKTNQFEGGFELTGSCNMDSDCVNACPTITGITNCTFSCFNGACTVEFTGNINTATADSISGRFWPMTGCSFDGSQECTGTGRCCDTGSCTISGGGFGLQCNNSGDSPNTVVEFTLTSGANNDFYDISLIDGYNVPVEMKPSGTAANAPNGFDTMYWCGNPGGLDSTTVSSLDCPWDTEFGFDCNGNPDFRTVGSLQNCSSDTDCGGSQNCNSSAGTCLDNSTCSNNTSVACTDNSDCGVCECNIDTDCNVDGDICGVPNPGIIGLKACGTLTGCTTAKDICGLYFEKSEKGDSCGQGGECASGTCLAPNTPATCTMDSECGTGNVCVDGQCQISCSVNTDCSDGAVCAEGICQCMLPNKCEGTSGNKTCTNDGTSCTTSADCTQTCDGICTEGPADFLSCNETVTNKKLSCTASDECPALVGLPACTADTDCPENTECVNFGAAPAPGKPPIAKVCRLTCDTDTNLCLGPKCTDNSDCTGMSNSVSLSGTFLQCDTTSKNCVATNTSLFEGAGLTGQSCYIDYYDTQVIPSAWCNGCPTPFNGGSGNANWPTPADPCLNSNPDWVSVAEPYVEGFKEACPSAYSFPFDDPTSTFQCTNDTQTNSMAYEITFCPAPQFPPPPPPPPPMMDEETTEPIKINPGENGPFVSIEFDPELDGGGQILVGLPPGVLAEFAQLNPVVGDCEIVSQTARVTDPDVICRVEDFPENLDMQIEFCKEADQQGVVQAAVEVLSDGMPEEEFSNFLDILLDELDLCASNDDDAGDDGSSDITTGDDTGTGGCSLTPAGSESNALPLLLLIPAFIIIRRLRNKK